MANSKTEGWEGKISFFDFGEVKFQSLWLALEKEKSARKSR